MTSHSASRCAGPARSWARRGIAPQGVDEAGGEVEAAPHPARVGAHDPVGGVDQVEALEQLVGAGVRAAAQAVQRAEQPQVLAAGEVLVDGGVLPGEPDAPAHRRRVAQHVDAGHLRVTGVGAQQGGQHADGGGLARAVRPEPRGTANVTPSSALVAPKVTRRSSATTARSSAMPLLRVPRQSMSPPRTRRT